jgi:hypothetical protein
VLFHGSARYSIWPKNVMHPFCADDGFASIYVSRTARMGQPVRAVVWDNDADKKQNNVLFCNYFSPGTLLFWGSPEG